jgi:hypothetical protein
VSTTTSRYSRGTPEAIARALGKVNGENNETQ